MVTSLNQHSSSQTEILTLLGLLCAPLWYWLGQVAHLPESSQALPYLTIHGLLWFALILVLFQYKQVGDKRSHPLVFSSLEWFIVLGFSFVFHLLAAASDPILETDPWRYLWDGKQLLHGINPYITAPSNSLAFPQNPAYFNKINHPHLATIYPPLAQFFFWLSAIIQEDSMAAWKAICIALSFATFSLLALGLKALGKRPEFILFLAWNPLWIKEFANSAHMDLVMLLPLAASAWALAIGKERLAMILLGLSALGKLTSLVLVPVMLGALKKKREITWVAVIMIAGYLPFMLGERWTTPFETLVTFQDDWLFHAFVHDLVLKLAQALGANWNFGMALGKILAAIVLLYFSWKMIKTQTSSQKALNNSFWMFTIFLLLSQVIFPWYVSWALAMAVFTTRLRAALCWTLLAPLAYTYYIHYEPMFWLKTASFALLAWFLWKDYDDQSDRGFSKSRRQTNT